MIASGSDDATVCLWDANTLQHLHTLKHTEGSNIYPVMFSPNGRWLLTRCDLLGSCCLWEVASGTGRQLSASLVKFRASDSDLTTAITSAFNPISTHFAISSAMGKIKILQTEGGSEWGYRVLSGVVTRPGTDQLMFSPDGSLLLRVSKYSPASQAMRVWDVHTGVEVLSLNGHKDSIQMACFSPCGKYIASASLDRTVRLWRTSDGSCITILSEHDSKVTHVAFSPDGKTLVSGSRDGAVIIRQMCDVLPLDERET